MSKRKLIGKVADNSGKAQGAAEVWLSAPGVATAKATTREDGSFAFELGDEFPAGGYRLEALPTEQALGKGLEVELQEDGPPAPVLVTVQSRGAVSAFAGWAFLLATIAALALVAAVYLDLHGFDAAEVRSGAPSTPARSKAISADLSSILAIAKEQVGQAARQIEDASDLTGEELAEATQEALESSMAMDSLAAAEGIFADLVDRRLGTLDASKVAAIEALFAQAKESGEAGDLTAFEAAVGHLETSAREPEEPFFWSERPQILLECLFWALAATLIRLIFRSGYYIYKRRFLATAIAHHLAVAVAVPILALLIGFFLSLVKVSLSLSEAELVLDMSNVYIVILVAALIGFSPWKAWDFMQGLADLLFRKLGEIFKSDRSGESNA